MEKFINAETSAVLGVICIIAILAAVLLEKYYPVGGATKAYPTMFTIACDSDRRKLSIEELQELEV